MRFTSAPMAWAASHRSTSRCALSQNTGELPNRAPEAERHLRTNRSTFSENLVDCLARDSYRVGEARNRERVVRQEVLSAASPQDEWAELVCCRYSGCSPTFRPGSRCSCVQLVLHRSSVGLRDAEPDLIIPTWPERERGEILSSDPLRRTGVRPVGGVPISRPWRSPQRDSGPRSVSGSRSKRLTSVVRPTTAPSSLHSSRDHPGSLAVSRVAPRSIAQLLAIRPRHRASRPFGQ